MFTSLEFSKKLKEAGCELLSDYWHFMAYPESLVLPGPSWRIVNTSELLNYKEEDYICERAYDIIYDICIKHAKEFFGEEFIDTGLHSGRNVNWEQEAYYYYSSRLLDMLQQNKSQDKIEKYIWDNCKFNPANN